MTCGPCQETSFSAITLNQESNFTRREKNHSYSAKIHWRIQNYSYEFGCYAREPHRWLLEYRWIERFVWFLDRFHTTHFVKRKASRRIYMWSRERTDETASNIYSWSFVARNLERKCQGTLSWGRSKIGQVKNQSSRMQEAWEEFISLILRTRNLKRPSRMLARNWKHQLLLLMMKNCGSGASNKIKTKLACILEAGESTRLRIGISIPHNHKDHVAGKGENSLQHYNLLHKFIPML